MHQKDWLRVVGIPVTRLHSLRRHGRVPASVLRGNHYNFHNAVDMRLFLDLFESGMNATSAAELVSQGVKQKYDRAAEIIDAPGYDRTKTGQLPIIWLGWIDTAEGHDCHVGTLAEIVEAIGDHDRDSRRMHLVNVSRAIADTGQRVIDLGLDFGFARTKEDKAA